MLACLRFHLLQVWRSRLVLLWIVFSLVVQYAVINVLHSATIQFRSMEGQSQFTVDLKSVVMVLLYAHFFTGLLLANVYGIWVVPYLHEDARAPLTYSLPVNKLVFPAIYSLSFLIIFSVQLVAMFALLFGRFGWSVVLSPDFPWALLLSGFFISFLSLWGVIFAMADISLVFGKVAAVFGGAAALAVLQTSGALFQAGWVTDGIWKKVYAFMPPIGETVVDIQRPIAEQHWALWIVWIAAFLWVFRLRLRRA